MLLLQSKLLKFCYYLKSEKVVSSCEYKVLLIPSFLLGSTTLKPTFLATLATVTKALLMVTRQQKLNIEKMHNLYY